MPPTQSPHLVADIGGTNTRVALSDGGVLRQGSIRRYANQAHLSLAEILRKFLTEMATDDCAGLCLAVAGPVQGGVAQMTNLDWRISATELDGIGNTTRITLLNDLQAQGHALASLDARHLHPLISGPAATTTATATATKLVVGAGTGFNAAAVHHLEGRSFVTASESGHIHLPQHGETEQALARHLAQQHGIASVEEVLSGRGLAALHHWRCGEQIAPGALIDRVAADDQACQTAALYAQIMGRVLASLALIHLPYGGIYLIGGVARAMAPHLTALGMAESFAEMGRMSAEMSAFSVHLVTDDYAALTGCAAYLEAQRVATAPLDA
ncbi:glucokinase [Pararhodobacter oceanensis]|uniref:glucokinase n=1 Tax=Pararhodobacter oceanensis TaxID=2172121 RepID=UPI003A906D11